MGRGRRADQREDLTFPPHAAEFVLGDREVVVPVGQPKLQLLDALDLDAVERHGVVAHAFRQADALERQEDVPQCLLAVGVDVLLEELVAVGVLADLHHPRCDAVDHLTRIGHAVLVVDDDPVAGGLDLLTALDGQPAPDARDVEARRLDERERRRVDLDRRRLDQLLVDLQPAGFVGDLQVRHGHQVLRDEREPEEVEGHLLIDEDVRAERARREARQVRAVDRHARVAEVRRPPPLVA